jgi:hypothetical protein
MPKGLHASLEERVLNRPAVILTALDAVDEHLRLRRKTSDLCELMTRVHRQARVRAEDHEPLRQTPACRFPS